MSLRFFVSLVLLLGALGYALFKLGGSRPWSLARLRGRGRPAAGGRAAVPEEERVRDLIRSIPKGRVVTFALLSAHAGPGVEVLRISREVRAFASRDELPWWRVVRREGRRGMVSSAAELGQRQRQMLEAEGVKFDNGTFTLSRYQWEP